MPSHAVCSLLRLRWSQLFPKVLYQHFLHHRDVKLSITASAPGGLVVFLLLLCCLRCLQSVKALLLVLFLAHSFCRASRAGSYVSLCTLGLVVSFFVNCAFSRASELLSRSLQVSNLSLRRSRLILCHKLLLQKLQFGIRFFKFLVQISYLLVF